MEFTTFAVVTALCFAFASTRIYAVIGIGLLLYFYPYATLFVLIFLGMSYFYYRKFRRRHYL